MNVYPLGGANHKVSYTVEMKIDVKAAASPMERDGTSIAFYFTFSMNV